MIKHKCIKSAFDWIPELEMSICTYAGRYRARSREGNTSACTWSSQFPLALASPPCAPVNSRSLGNWTDARGTKLMAVSQLRFPPFMYTQIRYAKRPYLFFLFLLHLNLYILFIHCVQSTKNDVFTHYPVYEIMPFFEHFLSHWKFPRRLYSFWTAQSLYHRL